jgi:hypothetical protein
MLRQTNKKRPEILVYIKNHDGFLVHCCAAATPEGPLALCQGLQRGANRLGDRQAAGQVPDHRLCLLFAVAEG